MGVIVNPRGTGGSGKTELIRRVLADYGWGGGGCGEPIRREGRARPIGHRLRHPLGGRPLAVLGHYGTAACGGCDTIPARDGGLDEAFRLADRLAAAGHDVLLEGLLLSGEHRRSAELARRHEFHVLRLSTPVERCVRNLVARRRAGRAAWPLIARAVAAQRDAVEDACARLRPYAASVEVLAFDEALGRARDLLGLGPVARARRLGGCGWEGARRAPKTLPPPMFGARIAPPPACVARRDGAAAAWAETVP